MARRKRDLDDGDDSDVSNSTNDEFDDLKLNADERDERDLLNSAAGRKRRRGNGKVDATYGVFGEDSDEEGYGRQKRAPQKRSDWTKAPAFISSDKKVDITKDEGVQSVDEEGLLDNVESDDGEEEDRSDDEDQETASNGENSGPASPRIREEYGEELSTTTGGIGSAPLFQSTAMPGPGQAGIGSKGGIGSSKAASEDAKPDLPSAFGSSRPQRAFLRQENLQGSRPATPLSHAEQVHFSKLSGSFGSRMLEKMGWQTGIGLGSEGTGIVTPVESKLRPKGMGIAFKGFKEKTEQSKAEARRRGEAVSDDEDKTTQSRRKKGKGQAVPAVRNEAWKKPKKSKVKTEHKTYEEIIASAGGQGPPSGIGKIIDATGAELREVASLADVATASWTPSTDPMRIPEARHNLRLITEDCKMQLQGLAQEARTIAERRKWLDAEDLRLRKKVELEADLIQRLQALHLAVDEINVRAKEASMSDYEPSLDIFASSVDKLATGYGTDFDRYAVDEVIVAAIAPTFRRVMATWQPLEDPTAHVEKLRRWRTALKMKQGEDVNDMQVDSYGAKLASKALSIDQPMTPYESLLWNIWLPRVRSAINNDWSPTSPSAAVKLYEAWTDVLPPFIKDNILDQLILPKVSAAVSKWSLKRDDCSLQSIAFPWLPHVGLRMETFVDEARRKIKSMLRSWSAGDGVPKDLLPWKEVFGSKEWEEMLLKYVVPKLSALLRDDFRVNPRNQDMAPLKHAFAWSGILRPSIIGQIIEREFFPKWLDVLYIWLVQPTVNYEEVAQWYQRWKETFPEEVRSLASVEQGFTRGLHLIDQALDLGKDAPSRLPKPGQAEQVRDPNASAPRVKAPSRAKEITFREIVEEFVASHNLLFMPAGKVDAKSRMPLYRISRSVDGRGGVLVYLLDDAAWISEDGGNARAVALEDLVVRATKS